MKKTNQKSDKKSIQEAKCSICEYRTKLMRNPDVNKKLIEDLAPKERVSFSIPGMKVDVLKKV